MEVNAIRLAAASYGLSRNDSLALPAARLLAAFNRPGAGAAARLTLLDSLLQDGTLSARLLEQAADGEAVLEAGGTRFMVRLPEQRRIGSMVLLTLEDGPAPRLLAQPAAAAPAEQISTAARLLTRLTSVPAEPDGAGPALLRAQLLGPTGGATTTAALAMLPVPSTPAAGRPVPGLNMPLAASPERTAQVALALGEAIGDSGLFYESHVQRWVAGHYPLERLQAEPQAPVRLGGPLDLGPGGTPGEKPPVVAEQLVPLVRAQLAAIDHQVINWSGLIFPQQTAQIEIQPDPPAAGKSGEQPLVWIGRVTLDMPRLGRVEALLALRGNHLALSLMSESPAAADDLAAGRAALEQALAARGLEAAGFFVAHEARKEAVPA